jgi:BON domain
MQAVIAELPSPSAREGTDLTTLARHHLDRHPHFRGRLTGLRIEHRGRTLFLSGRLPTFYLKQLVQEAVRHLPGVGRVRNEIDVVNPTGVSSVRSDGVRCG